MSTSVYSRQAVSRAHHNYPRQLASAIKDRRIQLFTSIEQAAECAGITTKLWFALESGAIPAQDWIWLTLAGALRVKVNRLYTLRDVDIARRERTGDREGNVAISLATGTPTGNFSLTTSASSLSVPAGKSASLTVNVTPQMGFTAPVSLSCSGLPTGATCSFSPTSITPAAGAAASSMLTVSTSSSTPVGTYGSLRWNHLSPAWSLFGGVAAMVFGAAWSTRKRRTTLKLVAACLGILLLALLAACGGGGMASSSPQGGSSSAAGQMTITATSGSISHSTGVTLMVQ